jgi:Zn-dependent protease
MLWWGMVQIFEGVLQFVIFLFALSAHEMAHAWVADKCGDPTSRYAGRITLNPIPHIDLFGTIIFPLILLLPRLISPALNIPIFGWAKPVMVNKYNFKNPRRDDMLVAAAGPGANVLVAILFIAAFRVLLLFPTLYDFTLLFTVIQLIVIINLFLAVFNLIPIPPLDGSHILEGLLRGQAYHLYQQIKPYGFILFLVMMYMGVIDIIARPVIYLALTLMRG